VRKWLSYLFDVLVFFFSPFVALAIRDNFTPGWAKIEAIVPFAVVGTITAAVVFLVMGIHKVIWRHVSASDVAGLVIALTLAVVSATAVISVTTRFDDIPRSVPVIQWGMLILILTAVRLPGCIFSRYSQPGRSAAATTAREHILVIGANHVAELYLRCVANLASGRISVEGILDENAKLRGHIFHSHKIIGNPKDLHKVLGSLGIRGVTIDRVVVTMPFADLSQKARDALLCWEKTDGLIIDMFEEKLGFTTDLGQDYTPKGARALQQQLVTETTGGGAGTDLYKHDSSEFSGGYAVIKRAMDIVGAAILLAVLSPLIALGTLLVAIDVGAPLFFWQLRSGYRGKAFRVYKFRTMKAGHDEKGNRIPDCKRQTVIGRFLRRTKMDELPQLYHILVGEMSFVGPRPLLHSDLPTDRPDFVLLRGRVRPGLTGWAQINGGNEVGKDDKLLLDMWYLENMSLVTDIRILLKTVTTVIFGEKLNTYAIRQSRRKFGMAEVISLAGQDLGAVSDGAGPASAVLRRAS
jgi:lipopolysaccharide/colanic/teichoic acid biosynthesis glycosyltransferase